jgi:O-acetyl-ADP-ribose deacetylase (regulator of RNase III)
MTEREEREYLIRSLLDENPQYRRYRIPEDMEEQRALLRALMNVREPKEISPEFEKIQNSYLQKRALEKGIKNIRSITPSPLDKRLFLWKGDITRLNADAIVNAANSALLGCFVPNHNCIDNQIHTFAGIQLRNACENIMEKQGHAEPNGQAKITDAYNLPAKYVIHTVGPVVHEMITEQNEEDLKSCYWNILKLADEKGLESVAMCCISTGVFGYPNKAAANTAFKTVRKYLEKKGSSLKVIFNVFKDEDEAIYKKLLQYE